METNQTSLNDLVSSSALSGMPGVFGHDPARMGTRLNESDLMFLYKAAHAGAAEVALGELAQSHATRPEVQQFAEQMVREHRKNNEALQRLARDKGVELELAPDTEDGQLLDRLRHLDAAEFDDEYLQHAGVYAHSVVERLFNQEASNGTDADLRRFAEQTLPVIRHHLDMAQQLTHPSA